MDQLNVWGLSSLAALAASMEAEAAHLRAVLPHAVGHGRAWMMLSWRAGYLERAAKDMVAAIEGANSAYEARLALRAKTMLLEPTDWMRYGCQIQACQDSGEWHSAFAFRQGLATDDEVRAAIRSALWAMSKAERESRPSALPD